MQQKLAQQTHQEQATRMPAQPASTSLPGHAPESRGLAAMLLSLQRTHGNRYVERMLKSAVLQRQCDCGGTCSRCETGRVPDLSSKSQYPTDATSPEGEPSSHRAGGHGMTQCDEGKIKIGVVEHCAGDCVAQHEASHALDMGDCCSKFKKCLDAGKTVEERTPCREKWLEYMNRLDDWTECNAYNNEAQCLTVFLKENCRGGDGGESAECCATLERELEFAGRKAATHCAASVDLWFCPFKPDGSIFKL